MPYGDGGGGGGGWAGGGGTSWAGGGAVPGTPTTSGYNPQYAQQAFQRSTGYTPYTGQPQYNPSSFGLAGAGQQYQQQQTAAPKPAAPAPTAPAAPYAPRTAITPGTPSSPGATTGNTGGQYVNGQWVPSITQTTTLSPNEQAILNQQQGLTLKTGGLAGNLMSNVPTTPMSFANAPAMPTSLNLSGVPTMPTMGQYNTEAANAVYNQQTAMLDPQWNQQEQQLRDQLRDQGIPEGSAAYNQQMTLFQNQKTTAYQQAKDAAVQEGYNVANQQFGQGMEARQQGVSEAAQQYQAGMGARQQGVTEAENLYQQPMNTLAQLYTAYQGGPGVQMPQAQYSPAQIQPTNVGGIVGQQGQLANQSWANQANVASQNIGGAAGLAGTLATGTAQYWWPLLFGA